MKEWASAKDTTLRYLKMKMEKEMRQSLNFRQGHPGVEFDAKQKQLSLWFQIKSGMRFWWRYRKTGFDIVCL